MSSHISAGMMTYPVNGATTSGYLARPSDDRPRAGLVVLQEWWGLERHMKELTDRFAEEGFVALTPDLYHGQVTADPAEAQRLSRGLNREQAVREIVAAATIGLAVPMAFRTPICATFCNIWIWKKPPITSRPMMRVKAPWVLSVLCCAVYPGSA